MNIKILETVKNCGLLDITIVINLENWDLTMFILGDSELLDYYSLLTK